MVKQHVVIEDSLKDLNVIISEVVEGVTINIGEVEGRVDIAIQSSAIMVPVDFQGATIMMPIDLQGSTIMMPIDLQGSTIMMPVDIQGQTIDIDVNITNSQINVWVDNSQLHVLIDNTEVDVLVQNSVINILAPSGKAVSTGAPLSFGIDAYGEIITAGDASTIFYITTSTRGRVHTIGLLLTGGAGQDVWTKVTVRIILDGTVYEFTPAQFYALSPLNMSDKTGTTPYFWVAKSVNPAGGILASRIYSESPEIIDRVGLFINTPMDFTNSYRVVVVNNTSADLFVYGFMFYGEYP